MEKLADIMKKLGGRYGGLSKKLEQATALGRWEAAVGPAIAKHSKAIKVQDGVLFVEVDHPIWRSELHHRKRQILELLNNARSEKRGHKNEVLSDLVLVDRKG